MNYNDACHKAYDYFKDNLGVIGLSTATENDEKWFFSAGKDSDKRIGNVIISLSKETGNIEMVDLLSDEGYETLKVSHKVEISQEYLG